MIRKFLAGCWDLIEKAKAEGATRKETWEIFAQVGCPVTFNTFLFYVGGLAKLTADERDQLGSEVGI